MKILFYLGHPAHYHLFRYAIEHFGDKAIVIIKSKDVLESLLKQNGVKYFNIEENYKKGKGGKVALAFRVLARAREIFKIIKTHKPGLLVGSPAELAIVGKLTGVPVCMFFEDDVEKVAPYGTITGPTATHLICPDVCSAGKWDYKKIGYKSYHELAYLHPDHFTPDRSKVAHLFKEGERNFIIRFVELGAFHDVGKTGLTDEMAKTIIDKLLPHGKVYITSERALPAVFEPYKISIAPTDIHHALYFADMFIGDSQTMTAEAAVLGTPALRFNDFVGELSYLEDLEHVYGLTYGFKTNNVKGLIQKLDELLAIPDLANEWRKRKDKLLTVKINLAKWMIDFLSNYPPKK
ncbi:MAG: DUF354 domain-containing protein [Bacteroidetes bacterium]|nr:DUF354 domain-containing protein [Bacteroidota bacterium]